MRSKWKIVFLCITCFGVAVYVLNASWRVPTPKTGPKLLSHRGVHQTYHREDLQPDDCTANRIYSPTHAFIENTLPSMRAAFDAGADVVELDVHPTTDGYFAVVHDWTLDCRTDGQGVTRKHDLQYLQQLDVGFGYTADGGKTFPLRGKGVGMMPELSEVFNTFAEREFLINFKSSDEEEGKLFAQRIAENPQWQDRIWGVYGGVQPTYAAARALPASAHAFDRRRVKRCLKSYIAVGWLGIMPQDCHDTVVMIPQNFTQWLWGWPHLLTKRFADVNTVVIIVGPLDGTKAGAPGIDSPDQLAKVPERFNGYVWTNKIEVAGPWMEAKQKVY